MTTKKKRNLQIALIIILTIILTILSGKSVSAVSGVSTYTSVQSFSDLYTNSAVYCLNYLWEFIPGNYLSVDSGSLDSDMAWLLYERT